MESKFKLKGKAINKEEPYFTITKYGLIYYFKDGLLHRENGPAIISEKHKEQYLNLGDEDLYKPSQSGTSVIDDRLLAFILLSHAATPEINFYYLNGVHHTEEEFNSILDKKKLHKDLNNDLISNQNNSKKLKV